MYIFKDDECKVGIFYFVLFLWILNSGYFVEWKFNNFFDCIGRLIIDFVVFCYLYGFWFLLWNLFLWKFVGI